VIGWGGNGNRWTIIPGTANIKKPGQRAVSVGNLIPEKFAVEAGLTEARDYLDRLSSKEQQNKVLTEIQGGAKTVLKGSDLLHIGHTYTLIARSNSRDESFLSDS
jgi:hypothetical protein